MDFTTVIIGLAFTVLGLSVAAWAALDAYEVKQRKASANAAVLDEYDELYNELRQSCKTRDELMKELIVGYVDLKMKGK